MFLDYLENCENHSSLCHWCMSKKQSGPIDFFEVIGAIPYLFGAYDFC
jgi:hypothetical protein